MEATGPFPAYDNEAVSKSAGRRPDDTRRQRHRPHDSLQAPSSHQGI